MATINGTAGNDVLTGTAGDDVINGLNGDDIIDGGLGADIMTGGEYNDIYFVDNPGDVVNELANGGQDTVKTKLNTYTIPAYVEWVAFIGTGAFSAIGNAEVNYIEGGSGNDVLDGGTNADGLEGKGGNDTYLVDNEHDWIIEEENGGTDTVRTAIARYQLHDQVENLIYTGTGTAAFWGTGNTSDNRIEGGAGDDTLDGNIGGNDTLVGFGGNDTYFVRKAGDVVVEAANQGNDTVVSWFSSYVLPDHVENLSAAYGALTGFTGTGNALNNTIYATDGDDVLDGMAGADMLIGGLGNDTYHVDHENDVPHENLNAGKDRVYSTSSIYSLRENVEELVYAGNPAVGAEFAGNKLDNYLQGGASGDNLWGDLGADTMVGLAGNDKYWVDNIGDVVVEAAGGGKDLVMVSLNEYQLPENVEDATFYGTGQFMVTGNGLANRLEGLAGHDWLDGKGGADTLVGWSGNDMYVVDDDGDVVVEHDSQGIDTVLASVATYTLGDNVERLMNMNALSVVFLGRGNALNNQLYGGEGKDILDGAGGADQMFGHKGDDTYWVNDADDWIGENADGGNDTVKVTDLATWTLGANLENLEYAGSGGAFVAVGNALDNHLKTGSGNDELRGGAGKDTMVGGLGNDLYFVDDAGDVVVEQAGEGIDRIWATCSSYVMGANVESLGYGGAFDAAFTVIGNAIDNDIETGEAGDYIDGGAGADRMTGRGGNDVYIVDNFGDVVVEFSFGGVDEVRTAIGSRTDHSQMYYLPANVENLTGTSASGQGVFANALDNIVKMGAGADLIVLHDGGVDRVESGGGDDYIYWGNSFTSADSNDGGDGYDTVGLLGNYSVKFDADDLVAIEKLAVYSAGGFGLNTYELTTVDANVGAGKNLMVVGLSLSAQERLLFNGSAELDGNFNIRGGKGDDALAGGAKADQLYGNLGADVLWGGAGKDQFEYFSAAESTFAGRDHILDFTAGDKINLAAIDADNNAANGNGKFAFIGSAGFGGVAGQLRAVQVGADWLVEGDVNGDSIADLSILVTTTNPAHILSAGDFYL